MGSVPGRVDADGRRGHGGIPEKSSANCAAGLTLLQTD
jgi:hypothetical protein